MASTTRYNKKNSAVKRILQEATELANDSCTDYTAAPLEDDIFEWYATIRGAPGTEFDGGLYRVRILLPAEYPFKAPDLMILTPNGRFETNKKICIDGLTSFHAGSWQPAWGVRTAIVGLMSFWQQSKGEALQAIGALDYPVEERRRLAKLSRSWKCDKQDGLTNEEMLPEPSPVASASSSKPEPASKPMFISSTAAATTDSSLLTSPNLSPSPAIVVDSILPSVCSLPPPELDVHTSSSYPSFAPPVEASSPTSLSSSSLAVVAPLAEDPPSQPASPPSPLAPVNAPIITPPAVPTPEAAAAEIAAATRPQQASAPSPTSSHQSPAPLWFDALFGLLVAALVVVVARRMI